MTITYVTVAIPYVNAAPHLGYAYELVQADVYARARRIAGDDVHREAKLARRAAVQRTQLRGGPGDRDAPGLDSQRHRCAGRAVLREHAAREQRVAQPHDARKRGPHDEWARAHERRVAAPRFGA